MDQNPPVCDTTGIMSPLSPPVLLDSPRPFGIFFSGWEWEYFIDLFLGSLAITVLADAISIDPMSFVKQPKHVRKEFFRGSEFAMST